MELHPGAVLQAEFLEPMQVSQNELARSIGVSPRRVNEIVLGKRVITVDTALRLEKFFATTAYFWLNLQMAYDLSVKRKELKVVLQKMKVCKKCN
jgi:addiction module HigA family antidote